MSGLVVVAVPADDDPVWQVSSEKAPHMTLLWFGDVENVASADIGLLKGAVQRAAASLPAEGITATVESREKLGDDDADVVMVNPDQLGAARDALLDDETVAAMFDAVQQYPKWTPHVTLGYPATPANGEPGDTIRFDRLAVWDGDYEGEEYPMGSEVIDPSEHDDLAAHDVIFYENRRTPEVVRKGQQGKKGGAGTAAGKVVKRRAATEEEEKVIRNGGWLRVNQDGKKPGQPGYMQRKSKIRPQNNAVEGEELGMTASSHWQPFTMVASAGIAAPLEDLTTGRKRRRKMRACITMPLSESASSALVIDNVVGADLSVPLIDLGDIETFTEMQMERVISVLEGLAASRTSSLSADIGVQYGTTDGVLWTRPDIQGLQALRARLVAELAQNNIAFDRSLPDPVIDFAYIGSHDIPDHVLSNTPTRAYFDRLALEVGDDVTEFPFGVLGSAMTAALVVDGDAVVDLTGTLSNESEPSMETPDINTAENRRPGAKFRIPLLVPEGVPTGDGRIFKPMSLRTRDLPLPLLWQIKTSDGHDGSVVVGRIDTIDRVKNGLGNALGVFDSGPYGREAERMVREKFLRGVSADLDQFEAVAEESTLNGEDDNPGSEGKKIAAATITVSKARVMGATIVPKPAFQEVTIELIEDDEPAQEKEPLVADGIYMDRLDPADAEALVACAMVASHIPTEPPASWFENPRLSGPTPLTVADDGRVFGHIAAWHVDHIGLPFGTRPPRSRSGYAYFHTGVCKTAEGKQVPVGQLTLAGGHASLELSANEAVKHYDDTASAIADVHAGEDAYGIYVAGALRPGTTPEQIRVLRASAPSGDWRPIQGRLELVAVCQVNVPGFPIARARVASGYVTALVAAGASALAELRGETVDERIARLERNQKRDIARENAAMVAARFHRTAELASPGVTEFRAYAKDTLEEYAKKGWAHKNKDGHISYPIADVADLRRAIRAYGRAKKEDKPAIRKHIMRRARGLDRPDLIPEQWMKSASIATKMELAKKSPDMELVADGVFAMTASLRYRRPRNFQEELHPRDEHGKFRKVLFRLKDDLEKKTGTKEALKDIDDALDAEDRGDDKAARDAANRLVTELDKIADNTADLQDAEDLKRRGADLAEVIARLPLPQGDADVKMRFTDLPVALRDLVEDLLDRLSAAVDQDTFDEVAGPLKSYMSGADYMHSDEIQSHLAKIMRYLI